MSERHIAAGRVTWGLRDIARTLGVISSPGRYVRFYSGNVNSVAIQG